MYDLKSIEKQIDLIESIYSKKMKHSSILCFKNNNIFLWDGELYFTTKCFINLEFIVETEKFLNLYYNIKDINLEIKKKENYLFFKSDTINIELPLLEDIFIPNIEIKNTNKLPEDFMDSLNICFQSVSTNITDGILNCFLINKDYIISCNNIEASKANMKESLLDRFLIHSSFYKRIKHLQLNSYKITNNFITFTGSKISSQSPSNSSYSIDYYLGTNMINDEYPNIEKYFEHEGILISLSDEFRKMINRVSSLIDTKEENEEEYILIKKKGWDIICSSIQNKGHICETNKATVFFPHKEENSGLSNLKPIKINPYLFNKTSRGFQKGLLKENCILFFKENLVRIMSLLGA